MVSNNAVIIKRIFGQNIYILPILLPAANTRVTDKLNIHSKTTLLYESRF